MTNEVIVERTFPASRELMFRAWSSAEHVKQWFSPQVYTVPEAEVDFRVGGAFNVCMQSPQGQRHWSRGRFVEIVPNSRLVIDMQAMGDDNQPLFRAQTAVNFIAEPGGATRMEVTQTYTILNPAVAAGMIAGAKLGWSQTLDKLDQEVTRIKASPLTGRNVSFGTFTIERTWPVPRPKVFTALTDPTAKAHWFAGGPEWKPLVREMDVRPGGRERVHGRWPTGTVSKFDAVYFDVVPDERLVLCYEMHLDERKISVSLATWELRSIAGGTQVTLTEQGAFLDGYDDSGAREHGSNHLLDGLEKHLRGSQE